MPATVPKVVVFDLGKVLVDFDYGIAARKIAAQSALGEPGVRQLLDHTPLLFRYETGLLTRETFYQEVCAGAGYRGSLREFSGHFADIFWEIEPMISLHALLRARGFPTFIFSNTNDLAVTHIRARFPFFSQFDGYIFSYEHGSMKPDAKIYEAVERATGQGGNAILYLDDRPENTAAGEARGWNVVTHETPEKTFQALRRLGLPVPGPIT